MESELGMHYIPIGNNEPVHEATGSCWCFPVEVHFEDIGTDVIQHNAKDVRERFERQGIFLKGAEWIWVSGIRTPSVGSYFKP